MMRCASMILAILLAGVLVPAAAADFKVGVVDLNLISDSYEKHKEEVARLRQERDAVQAELSKMEEQVKGLTERRQLFGEDSEEYNTYTIQLEELKMKLLVKKNTEERRIEKRQLELVKSLFRDIQDAVREFAAAQGYNLIMVKTGEELTSTKLQEVFIEIRMKPVIFASPELDVTAAVIDYMNGKYRRDVGNRGRR